MNITRTSPQQDRPVMTEQMRLQKREEIKNNIKTALQSLEKDTVELLDLLGGRIGDTRLAESVQCLRTYINRAKITFDNQIS